MKMLSAGVLLLLATSAHAGPPACVDITQGSMMMAQPVQLFHVKGKHQCQSRQNIGYWADVELRNATDCTAGHSRLRMQNPCSYYNGIRQENGMSIGYIPGSCSNMY